MALTPEIRPIEAADWPQVLDIVVEVALGGETYALEVPRSLEEVQAFWSGESVVVAVEGDKVLGSAKSGPNRDAQGAHVGTGSFIVASGAQGRGVGRALGEHVVESLRERGYRAVQFNAVVSTNRAAVRLWSSLGFETVGVVPDAFRRPSGEYADLLVMHLDLTVATAPSAARTRIDTPTDRAAVLATAARHFIECGWDRTDLASVAAEAGFTHTALRRVFPTKADVMMAALRLHVFDTENGLGDSFPGEEIGELVDIDERLHRHAVYVTEVVRRFSPLLGVLASAQASDPTAQAILKGAHMRRLPMSRKLVEQVTRGDRPLPDAVAVVQTLVTAENYQHFQHFGWDDDHYVAWLQVALDQAVNGSLARMPSPGEPTPS